MQINETCPVRERQSSFAAGINFYKLLWIFTIGCFLGVVVESGWCLVTNGYYESRTGLVIGPFNPVYGFGAVLMTVCLQTASRRGKVWIFVCGAVLGAVFEFVCSWLQERVFGTVSWEYGESVFHIAGRINLKYTIFWGVLAFFWMVWGYPQLSACIERIPNHIGKKISWLLAVFLIFDILLSAAAVGRMVERIAGQLPENSVEVFLDKAFPDSLMEKIYPNMMDASGQLLRQVPGVLPVSAVQEQAQN